MALSTCTSLTLRQYTKRHSLTVDDIAVTLSHARDHAEDCAVSAERPVKLDRIVQRIDIHGHLSALERERLLKVPSAVRCIARWMPTRASRPALSRTTPKLGSKPNQRS
ncbi:MAG: OsmC family protein [Thermochromatium sp.]